jgi:hypothetical protein
LQSIRSPHLTQRGDEILNDRIGEWFGTLLGRKYKTLIRAKLPLSAPSLVASFHAMQAVESTNIIRSARSMRLTHQTIYRADSTKHRPVLPSAMAA